MSPLSHEVSDATIEALLSLSDDETSLVRAAVTREINGLDIDIPAFIHSRHLALSETHYQALEQILWERNHAHLMQIWREWIDGEEGSWQLERAMSALSHFQNGARYRPALSMLLDDTADAFAAHGAAATCPELSRFLFEVLGYTVMPEMDANSGGMNLARVMEMRHGLPMALSCIFLLLGGRLNLKVSGCRWPGSSYARFSENDVLYMVDFHNNGAVVTAEELLSLQGPSRKAAEAAITLEMSPVMMVKRIVNELVMYYRREENPRNSIFMLDLLRMLDRKERLGALENAAP